MNWVDILGNVASGGVLGLLGTVVNFGLGFWQKKQEHAQRLEWSREERELLKTRGQLAAAETAGDIAVARERGAADAFVASQQAEARIGRSYKWVEAVRGLTRPVLTLLLIVLCAAFYASGDFTTRAYIAQNIVVTAVACVTWWFGQRQLDRTTTSWGNAAAGASVQGERPRQSPTRPTAP